MPYRIIGVMADKNQNSSYSGLDEKKIWLPYTTMTRDVPPKDDTYMPGIWTRSVSAGVARQFEERAAQVKRVIGRAHDFDPDDKSAIGVWDTVENQKQVDGIFDSMTVFLALHRLGDAVARRHRRDEHHAGDGVRADARDRPAQGAGRDAAAHPGRFSGGRLRAGVRERADGLGDGVRAFERAEAGEDAGHVSGPAGERADHGAGVRRAERDRDCVGAVSGVARRIADAGGGAAR